MPKSTLPKNPTAQALARRRWDGLTLDERRKATEPALKARLAKATAQHAHRREDVDHGASAHDGGQA